MKPARIIGMPIQKMVIEVPDAASNTIRTAEVTVTPNRKQRRKQAAFSRRRERRERSE